MLFCVDLKRKFYLTRNFLTFKIMRFFLQKILLYGMLLLALNFALGLWLKTYETIDLRQSGAFFPADRWDEYYDLTDSIDVLILGSSHAYRSYYPPILESNFYEKKTVFNFGSSAQSPVTGYFILQEILQKHKPEMVVIDVYIMALSSDDQLENGRFNYNEIKKGNAKNDFFKNGFSFAEKIKLSLFPTEVYRKHFKAKMSKLMGRNYLPVGKGNYDKKGFVFNQDTLNFSKLKYDNQFARFDIKTDNITAKNEEYLQKIVDLCQENRISVVLMSAPMPEESIKNIKNYAEISQWFSDFGKREKVLYFDFSIDRILEIKDTEHYYDDDHLNFAGAKIYSKKVGELLKGF